jgi:hypothetical protein
MKGNKMDFRGVTSRQIEQIEQNATDLLALLRTTDLDNTLFREQLAMLVAEVAIERQSRLDKTAIQEDNVLKQLPNWDNEGGSSN